MKHVTFAVKVAKMEAIRLLGEAMRKKQADFVIEKAEYAKKMKEIDDKEVIELKEFQKRVSKLKNLDDDYQRLKYPQRLHRSPQPTLSLCDEKQLLTMLRADTREVIPVPEGSLLWTLIQGKCTPIK